MGRNISKSSRNEPLLEALFAGGFVFFAFALSALMTHWHLFSTERERVRQTLHASTWEVLAAIKSSRASGNGTDPQATETILRRIENREGDVDQLELIWKTADGYAVVAKAPPGAPQIFGRHITGDLLNPDSGGGVQYLDINGQQLVVVPQIRDDGAIQGFSLGTAQTSGFMNWILGDRSNLLSFLGIGASTSALAGFLIYSASGKFHRAFRKLAEAEKRLRDVSDVAGEYIWEVDNSGRFTFLSDRVREVLGRKPADMLGHHPFEYLPEEEREAVRERSNLIVAAGQSFRDFEHRMVRNDGRMIWLSVNGVPILDEQGVIVGYRGAAMDITARKEGEAELVREKDAAQAAAVAKSQFLAVMSHEIRTPLNSVLGFADLLAKTQLAPEQRAYLDLIRSNGDGLLNLLNDILEFSRAEAGIIRLEYEPVELPALAKKVMSLHEPAAAAKGVVLRLEVESGFPVALMADPARLRQILLNLIGNAVKFTDSGEVVIHLSSSGARVPSGHFPLRLSVRDTGPGIPPDKRAMLFQPFSQVDSSATRRHGGTGLGLVICKRLAELFGGEIFLADSTAAGSTFVFEARFEIVHAPARDAAPAVTQRLSLPWKPKILVAEDNAPSRKLMRAMLGSLGLVCEEATNGAEALAAHAARSYDLIFMDIQMPEMDGLTATRELRRLEAAGNLKRVAIVALTANAIAGDRERCIDAGMDEYLSKPVRKDDLLSILSRAENLTQKSA